MLNHDLELPEPTLPDLRRQPISWVIQDRLAIGSFADAQNRELVARSGIDAVLSLAGLPRHSTAEALGVKELVFAPLADGRNEARVFRQALFSLERLMQEHPRVLVQCHAGRSRSPALVAAYLIKNCGLSLSQTLDRIRSVREVSIAPELIASIRRICGSSADRT